MNGTPIAEGPRFGLAGFGRALGRSHPLPDIAADRAEELERLVGYGYERLHIAEPGQGVTDLAVQAGCDALSGVGIRSADVDLVVFAVTDIVEHLYWDAASSLAHRLGAEHAEAVLMTQACTTGIAALDTVAGKFATHPDYHTALIVAGNRTVEAYNPRLDTQPLLFSDGAAAAVAVRGHPQLRWIVTEIRTDASLADLFRLEDGGAARPFAASSPTHSLRVGDAWSVMEHFDYDPDRFSAFMRGLDSNLADVVRRACSRAGRTVRDIDHLLFTHETREAYDSAASAVGADRATVNDDLAVRHGHLGSADHLHDLSVRVTTGAVQPGQLIALAGRGRGMHWACSLLEG